MQEKKEIGRDCVDYMIQAKCKQNEVELFQV